MNDSAMYQQAYRKILASKDDDIYVDGNSQGDTPMLAFLHSTATQQQGMPADAYRSHNSTRTLYFCFCFDSKLLVASAGSRYPCFDLGQPTRQLSRAKEQERTRKTTRKQKKKFEIQVGALCNNCLLYTSPSPRDRQKSRMPSSA